MQSGTQCDKIQPDTFRDYRRRACLSETSLSPYDTALRRVLLGSNARTTCHAVQALQLAKSLRTLLVDHKITGGEGALKAFAAPPVAAIWLNRSSTYAVAVLAVLASG